uniref:Uncharacterized protein n=1 Tax=viral metagenome TaxID=1070528 RepID=A0A6M3M7C4_9ZZZZ
MPEVGTKVRESGDDVEIGKEYEIVNVESVTTEISFYKGIRVELLTKKAEEGSIMLWERPITTSKSKLGIFITLLGSNTDGWLHKRIKIVDWRQGARIIELVK